MKLSDSKLSRPNHGESFMRYRQVSYLERSFLSLDQEQIQQWEGNGILARAMNGGIGQRKDYATTLPYFVLVAANQSRRKEEQLLCRPRPYADFEQVWRQLRSMSRFSPAKGDLNLWLSEAASLPLADELIKEGANPHGEVPNETSLQTPFIFLVNNYLALLNLKNKQRPGWPQVCQEIADTRSRLLSWLDMPGMSSDVATTVLGLLTYSALVAHPQEDDVFLKQLRNGLLLKGATLNLQVLSVFSEAVAPKANWMSSSRCISDYEKKKIKQEDYRTGSRHRARIIEWANTLSSCKIDMEERDIKTCWDRETWKRWLCLPGSHILAARMAGSGISPWNSKGSHLRDLLIVSDPQDAAILIDEIVQLDKVLLKQEVESMPIRWKQEQAAEFMRSVALQPTEQVKKLFNWVNDIYITPQDVPDDLTRAWFRSRIRLSVKDGAGQVAMDLRETLEWLHSEGRLEFMIYREGPQRNLINIVGHVLEGGQNDTDMVNSEWSTWLHKPEFRSALLGLPEPYAQRVKTMSAFFPLCADDRIGRLEKIQEATSLNPYIKGELRAFMRICSQRPNASLSDRLMRWEDVTSINHVNTSPETSWTVLAQSFTPDMASDFSLDNWRSILDYQQERFPLIEGPLITVKALVGKEMGAPNLNWAAMVPLVDEFVRRGLDPTQLPPMQEPLEFARAVEAVRQAATLSCNTSTQQAISRRARL